ncbi:unnamed protein product [Microthlaspi erraticum]|uniref:Reverse transcriptase domain-containing protein n=1 Tax=Microthlaspi erraticum TaxID=1685480 RepID=A0A6D2ILE4_9BRAS|nr:unnamed protein product [Microthlaspi erraticum]
MCGEALVSCLNFSEAEGKLHGIGLSPQGPTVHHLLFADDSLLMCKAASEEAAEIIRCLKLYGDASGQLINSSKSSIIFGSKVPDSTKLEVKRVLRIEKEGGEGTYLGLPECFSGSKRKMLHFIQEKLQKRTTGWFAQALSQGGKEILLKAVGLALPVFAMSCFCLPKGLCEKLTSIMTEFWWSSGNDRNKIPWVACKSKENGGLGFHDIGRFNQALLGKEAWRIWSRPESLVARILKHRYFRHGSFFHCAVGRRPSYAWRSILFGRDLLLQGMVKVIGNGKDTKVWVDNWITDDCSRPPMYNPNATIDLTLVVSDLLDEHTGRWRENLIRQYFVAEDATRILQIKPSLGHEDKWRWGFSKDGNYTSKSGYLLLDSLYELQEEHPQTLPQMRRNFGGTFGRLKLPSSLSILYGEHSQRRYEPAEIVSKALDEADIWRRVHYHDQNQQQNMISRMALVSTWKKPPNNMLKCNIGVSWVGPNRNCGVSWVLRDSKDCPLVHSRSSYASVPSATVAELLGILWAVESMRDMHRTNIIFESSLLLAKKALMQPSGYVYCRNLMIQINRIFN